MLPPGFALSENGDDVAGCAEEDPKRPAPGWAELWLLLLLPPTDPNRLEPDWPPSENAGVVGAVPPLEAGMKLNGDFCASDILWSVLQPLWKQGMSATACDRLEYTVLYASGSQGLHTAEQGCCQDTRELCDTELQLSCSNTRVCLEQRHASVLLRR